MTHETTHIDPIELHPSTSFTQGVVAPAGPTLYVGGQNGINVDGQLAQGVEAQTVQAMRNVLAVITAASTGPEHVVKLTIYLTSGVDLRAAFRASLSIWGKNRTAITVLIVAGLALPGALVEVDAIAFIP